MFYRVLALAGIAAALGSNAAWAGELVVVPEPTSIGLLATGVGALLIYRVRKRK